MTEIARTGDTNALAVGKARSLDEVMRERRRFLLVDFSFSMADPVSGDRRKIDVLRDIVYDLRAKHGLGFRQICFGLNVEIREDIPEPAGGTPLTQALELAREHGAKHIVVVSDGLPDNPESALAAAATLAAKIDTFYVGPEGSEGSRFLARLAAAHGGRSASGKLDPEGARLLKGEVEKALLALPAAIAL